jgi:hypothetical protein
MQERTCAQRKGREEGWHRGSEEGRKGGGRKVAGGGGGGGGRVKINKGGTQESKK